MGFYELLLRDNEPEVRSEAVAKVPIMANHCTTQVLIDRILPIIKEQISNDPSQHVKGSMAYAICDLGECLSKEDTITYILPPIMAILKDSATEVRVSLLQNIAKLIGSLEESEIKEHILPEITKLAKDNTWRVRLATIKFVPQLPKYISISTFEEVVEPVLLGWLEDSVHGVRMETINCIIQLKTQQFDLKWMEALVDKKLQELHIHARFNFRIHTLFMINELEKEVSDQFLNDKMYKGCMKKLADDPVPNIRFNYSKTVAKIYPRLTNSNKMDSTGVLKKQIDSDLDFDVKFYASKSLNEI